MKKLGKVLLASSVILLAVSLTGPGGDFMWGALKPLSALLFGGAFISYLLADEYAKYDREREQRSGLTRVRRQENEGTHEPDRDTDFTPKRD